MRKISIAILFATACTALQAQTTPYPFLVNPGTSTPASQTLEYEDPASDQGYVGIGTAQVSSIPGALTVSNMPTLSAASGSWPPAIIAEVANVTSSSSPLSPGTSLFSFGVQRINPAMDNGVADFVVDQNGLVGIGNFPAQGGSACMTCTVTPGNGITNAHLFLTDANADGYPLLAAYTNAATPSIVALGSGYVGIGTATPSTALDVAGNATFENSITVAGSTFLGSYTHLNGNAIVAGSVGIGVSPPLYPLDVSGNANISGTLNVGNTLGGNATINNGGEALDLVNATGYAGWANQIVFKDASGAIRDLIYDDYTVGATNGNLVIQPGYYGQGSGVLNINGKVQIGNVPVSSTTAATLGTDYMLYVQKGIIAEKFKCALSSDATNWSDYVFDKDYKLASLNEVEAYVKANHHLPGVPSTEDVHCEGIDLAQMDATLLKKIEELTLYVLDLKKDNEAMKAQLSNIKK